MGGKSTYMRQTALITGGGPWPLDSADAGYLGVEIFDPEKIV